MQDPLNPEKESVLTEQAPVVAAEETVVPTPETTPETKPVEEKPPAEPTEEEIAAAAEAAITAEITSTEAKLEEIKEIEEVAISRIGGEQEVGGGPSAGGDQSFEETSAEFLATVTEARGTLAAAHAEGQGSDGNTATVPPQAESAVEHTVETASARPIPSLEGDPEAPDTPQEITETFEGAVAVEQQALDVSISFEKSGLVGVIPSKTELRAMLPKDSPLLLPSNERVNLSPEQAVRAEVDAYGLLVAVMASIDLSNMPTPDDPKQAAANFEMLANMFDAADRMREEIPDGAKLALTAAMRDAAKYAVRAPNQLSSDSEVSLWVSDLHKNIPAALREQAKFLRGEINKPPLTENEPVATVSSTEEEHEEPANS